jgi:hypothetical protein
MRLNVRAVRGFAAFEVLLESGPEAFFFAAAAALRRPLAASSDGSSRVSYLRHTVDLKWRITRPSLVVDVSCP